MSGNVPEKATRAKGIRMAVPAGIATIDTMIGLPSVDRRDWYKDMAPILRDEGSKSFEHPAGYMFKHTPTQTREPDSIDHLLLEMDRFGIERGLVPVNLEDELHVRALSEHPDRLFGSLEVDPNRGVAALRELDRAVREHGVIAAQFFRAGKNPAVAVNSKLAYPLYAKCIELDIPLSCRRACPAPA